MHSHHSHSGSYVAHGVDALEDIVSRALQLKFQTYCLTEHMPRIEATFLYPEETKDTETSSKSLDRLQTNFEQFLQAAVEIRDKNAALSTRILIGTEVEACNLEHILHAKTIMAKHSNTIQFCVGSLHHVNSVPIDYDQQQWYKAFAKSNNNLQEFLNSYLDLQLEMLQCLQPLVVGHFDIYKLFLPQDMCVNVDTGAMAPSGLRSQPIASLSLTYQWDSVKNKIIRNLKYIASYGGLIEINSAGLRKGLGEPYPGRDICLLAKQYCNGRFVLSDDAHAINQVATCYKQALDFIENLAVDQMYYLNSDPEGRVRVESVDFTSFKNNPFWATL